MLKRVINYYRRTFWSVERYEQYAKKKFLLNLSDDKFIKKQIFLNERFKSNYQFV